MRFKLDENLDVTLALLLQQAGHDVETVLSQRLSGQPDAEIYRVCQAENRGSSPWTWIIRIRCVFQPRARRALSSSVRRGRSFP
jgi:hypothetical protein